MQSLSLLSEMTHYELKEENKSAIEQLNKFLEITYRVFCPRW